ncbi:hypothetical protein CTA2_10290 [Colletotrichum tanaceti]|uniref:Uncharacterized protein n=1 Tax=Colletotrichum tanaceti TaxID=1306861 RepID=A0A4U6XVI4_9PEZI|nr:hypothetical protein CTA2_10290 [Colletotrichum tanaceti]TKW59984.1 hypothetical protein CTA1_9911 [Colletotrichum tanaceti]
MRVSIIARAKETCEVGLSYYECNQGYRGCCHFNPCPGTECARESTSTQSIKTVASVAAPIFVSATDSRPSKKVTVITTTITTTHKTQPPEDTTTTVFIYGSTGPGGAWYTDSEGRRISSISSLDPFLYPTPTATPVEPQVLITSTSIATPQPEAEKGGLSAGVRGGIAASIMIGIVAIIAAWFLCTKQRKKLRTSRESISSISRDESKNSSEEDHPSPQMTADPIRRENVSSFGGRYEEPQARFDRANDTGSDRMMNHPVNSDTRASAVPQPQSAVVARATTASPDFIPRTANASPDFACRTANATPDLSRVATVTPDFMCRLGTATPELHGPPQQAAIAELASPGLPRVVEIHSSRSGVQMYKPYRPNGGSLYPVAETTPSYLTGTLNATENERSQGQYVNSWAKWDSVG